MSATMHTVALDIPGTQTRVLVEHLVGTPTDAECMAREVIGELFSGWARARTRIVRSDEIKDVQPSPETT